MPSSYSIGEHYEAFAKELVASGRYASVSEVLRDGLRLMEEREALRAWKLNELKKAIQDGLDSGEPEPMESLEDFLAEARARRAADDAA
ncbi:type II toxin-antitoxin system ParD family antitoxin [Devosia ginsengisoli]|uniref:Type II toxin-antitoxin system ParD family antitoxin n=1 Tax=Devosia ginsengisoli TaxID=400770 RepID=A0A5B8LV62_9HYPH|nr:type II toxin-antitoxin system ParD family antitoxin [Devosia ginsengisoli]QDZ11554.1 type II toxin-antitoxin system ParD family antitoxin [Devosia ginsengisoli]